MLHNNSGNVNPFLDRVKKATAAAAADKAAGNDEWRVVTASTYQTPAKANSSKSYRDADNWNLHCGITKGEIILVEAEVDYRSAYDMGGFRCIPRGGGADDDAWDDGKRPRGTTISRSGNLQVKLFLREVINYPRTKTFERQFMVYLPLQTKNPNKKSLQRSQRIMRDILLSAYWYRFDEDKPEIPTPRGPEALIIKDYWAFDGLVFPIETDFRDGWGADIRRVITPSEKLWLKPLEDERLAIEREQERAERVRNPYIEDPEGIRLIVGVDIFLEDYLDRYYEARFDLFADDPLAKYDHTYLGDIYRAIECFGYEG